MDREGARKEFEDLHGYNNPARSPIIKFRRKPAVEKR
jgi:hypothetical protein